jgi:hypothetical protein
MSAWVTDFRDAVSCDGSAPAAGWIRAEFTRDVVEAATSRRVEAAWQSIVQCIGRIDGRPCGAYVEVRFDGTETVEWSCSCCGDVGKVRGFVGTEADLSRFVPRGKVVNWGFDDEEWEVLREGTSGIPELRAVVARARPHAEVGGLLLVSATVSELDSIYTLVEELADLTRSRQLREVLDGVRMTLCTSMDGF